MAFFNMVRTGLLASVGLLALGTAAIADAGHEITPNIGQTGDVSHIDRVIEVKMGEMYFKPNKFDITKGETIKFVITNAGRAVHEFALGTEDMQKNHEAEMREMQKMGMITVNKLRHDKMRAAGMMHTDANARLLDPKATAELVWTFSGDASDIIIACNVPGHRQAGMHASLNITGVHS